MLFVNYCIILTCFINTSMGGYYSEFYYGNYNYAHGLEKVIYINGTYIALHQFDGESIFECKSQ